MSSSGYKKNENVLADLISMFDCANIEKRNNKLRKKAIILLKKAKRLKQPIKISD